MSVTIQVKRNTNTDEGALAVGEFGFHDVALGKLFIGSTTGNQEIATTAYVDAVAQGLRVSDDVEAATTEALAACTYDNGTAGVGATLTEDAANGALAAIDGVTLTLNQRVLVKNQADTFENGIYQLSQVGTGAAKWILTRVTDMDQSAEIAHTFVFVKSGGTTYGDTGFVCTSQPELTTVGTDPITWSQFSAAGHITAGTGLTKTGNTLNIDFGIANAKAVKIDAADVADDEFARFTANGLESRSAAEVKSDIGLGNVTNIKDKFDATAAPTTGDDTADGYAVGSFWLDVTADKAYLCLDASSGAAVWKEVGSAGSTAFIGLSDVPANFTDAGLKVVRVNSGANALEFVAFAATYLDDTAHGTDAETAKAATSNVLYDHDHATTGVHGAGGNTLLHSGSTIDGGTWGA